MAFSFAGRPKTSTYKFQAILWIGLVAFLALLILHPRLCRAQPYRLDRLWPTLQQPWYFSVPNAMAVDREGHVFIADTDSLAVKKFTGDGHLVTEWAVTHPGSVAIDPDGIVYVAGEGAASVLKYTGNGEWIGGVVLPAKGACSALAAGVDGELYVAADYNHRVYRFSPEGELEADWGGEGDGEGRFDSPRGVAVDRDGYVYVADRTNDRIQKFTLDGRFLANWESLGGGPGEFDRPRGIAIGREGRVYVADANNHRVQAFTPDGGWVNAWGEKGAEPGQLNRSYGVAVDNQYVYVADTGHDRPRHRDH